MREPETCFACALTHPKVEARGIWYCPNALCRGCGGAWFRIELDSYKDVDNNRHTVDPDEWLEKGIKYNKENNIRRRRFR